MFSPEWGLGGLRLTHLESTRVMPGIADLERGIAAAIARAPGIASLAVIAGEMFTAVGLALRRLWPYAIAANIAFALALEFLLVPAMFPWDLLALMILFLPAADGAYRVRLSVGLRDVRCRSADCLRRSTGRGGWTCTRHPRTVGRSASRRRAAGVTAGGAPSALLPWALPAPFLSLLIVLALRLGVHRPLDRQASASTTWCSWCWPSLALLLLPAADRGMARTLFERLAPVWNRALRRALRTTGSTDDCPRHRRRPGGLTASVRASPGIS